MKTRMSEVAPELQATFYGVAIFSGFGLLALFFTVCSKLHRQVQENEHKLEVQHQSRQQVSRSELWASMQQKTLLDQRKQNVDRLDLFIRLVGGVAVLSGLVGFIVLGVKRTYGFNPTTGTLPAILLELLPFISLAGVLATLFVTLRAISLDKWFARSADVALPPNGMDAPESPES